MPLLPREWVVWTCHECESVVNVAPSLNVANRNPRCPYCQFTPRVPVERRAAIDIPGMGLIGATETAGLDYLASIANSLVDIRNKFFAVHHVPEPINVGGESEMEPAK
jgi:DNA-directed RNA polymerase subunit RPC12/RpoP